MTVSNNTIVAESMSDFFRNLGEKDIMYQKMCQKMI